jgi:NOL1/NOP2/sun family putative RNA methylase
MMKGKTMYVPEKFSLRMEELLKDEYNEFLSTYEGRRYQAIRVNTLKIAAQDFIRICPFKLYGGVAWEKRGYYIAEDKPGKHPYHAAGLYYVQEPSAMSVVPCLKIKPGHRVLDLCAAPGGKSTQAAAYLEGQGLLVSNEIEPKRARVLSENIERMGIRNAVVTNNTPQQLQKVFEGYFDRIIVDAPCSGEGMFKKEEAAIQDWSQEAVEGCAIRQREIIDSAGAMLKPGGLMIYSTCTFSTDENEGIIGGFLKKNPEFSIENIPKEYGFVPGFTQYGQGFGMEGAARLFPHKVKGEGHFLCLLRKNIGNEGSQDNMNNTINREQLSDYYKFAKTTLKDEISGNLYLKGEELYALPMELCQVKGLRILRGGLQLGTLKKNRFEPNHALALALKENQVVRCVNLSSSDESMIKYLKGEVLEVNEDDGWCLVAVDGYSIGWGKVSSGKMKNHYPKGLRW